MSSWTRALEPQRPRAILCTARGYMGNMTTFESFALSSMGLSIPLRLLFLWARK